MPPPNPTLLQGMQTCFIECRAVDGHSFKIHQDPSFANGGREGGRGCSRLNPSTLVLQALQTCFLERGQRRRRQKTAGRGKTPPFPNHYASSLDMRVRTGVLPLELRAAKGHRNGAQSHLPHRPASPHNTGNCRSTARVPEKAFPSRTAQEAQANLDPFPQGFHLFLGFGFLAP